ncbi:MAG TPA: hypothetical protein VIH42_12535 [Thermoguttaceae bacterium]
MSLLGSSHFRRSAGRDDRRRRLLAEEINDRGANPLSSVSSTDVNAGYKLDHYGAAAFIDEQVRLIDFVPLRLTTFTLWILVGLAIIAGVEFLHGWQSGLSAAIPGGQFQAFDVTRSGSLYSWFSSLLLLAVAATSMLVYTIRRYKTDDYQGRYRIWLWAAVCWFLLATDVAANLHDSFKQIMIDSTKTLIWGDGTLWWIIPYAVVFGALGSRLVLDMRHCWLSIITFLLAAAGYLVSACMELGLLTIDDTTRLVMIKSGAAMYAHLMLLVSMGLNARYVILDAQGFLPHLEAIPDTQSDEIIKQNALTTGDEWMRVDSASGTPQPAFRRSTTTSPVASAVNQTSSFSSHHAIAPVTRKLTKQEKKALRDRLLRERMERQRQQNHKW